jgi:hypothetical protein
MFVRDHNGTIHNMSEFRRITAQLLANAIPQLPARFFVCGKVVAPPPAVRGLIKKASELRNSLVHKGEDAPELKELEPMLEACRDVLWLLDYYSGMEWAWSHIDRRRVRRSKHGNAATMKPPLILT